MSDTVQCSSCQRSCHVRRVDISLSDILFVEISPAVASAIQFKSQINLENTNFSIKGLVRNSGAHFTCAVEKSSSTWEYFDDMSEHIIQYSSLQHMFGNKPQGCFFVVYVKDTDTHTCSDITDSINHFGYGLTVEHSYVKPFSCAEVEGKCAKIDSNISSSETQISYTNLVGKKRKIRKVQQNKYYKQGKFNEVQNPSTDKINNKTQKQNKGKAKSSLIGNSKGFSQQNKVQQESFSIDDRQAKNELRKFHQSMIFSIQQCSICYEAWPIKLTTTNYSKYECRRCRNQKNKKFGKQNFMVPCSVPPEL